MFKILTSSIEKNRNSDKFAWRLLVLAKDAIWKFYDKFRVSLLRGYYLLTCYYSKDRAILRNLIEDKRVLIVGSGSSAKDLNSIPTDVKILTCNEGLRLFTDGRFNREVDLFFSIKSKMERRRNIQHLIRNAKIKAFIVDDLNYIKKKEEFKNRYSQLLFDYSIGNFMLKGLIRPHKVNEIKGRSLPKTSSGMRLLQYALYFKAKEIYLIGMDFGQNGCFWDTNFVWLHPDMDENFLKIVSKKYGNVYSLSKNSPVTRYIEHKPL
jgi:hypothetical protein